MFRPCSEGRGVVSAEPQAMHQEALQRQAMHRPTMERQVMHQHAQRWCLRCRAAGVVAGLAGRWCRMSPEMAMLAMHVGIFGFCSLNLIADSHG